MSVTSEDKVHGPPFLNHRVYWRRRASFTLIFTWVFVLSAHHLDI